MINNGMMHVTSNAQLEVDSCIFQENYSFGRGVIIYSELLNSMTIITNVTFFRNSGFQGGVIYISSDALIIADNCTFQENFAFNGGVAYLQNDGNLIMRNSIFIYNFAIRASLIFMFNSVNSLKIDGGIIKNNGFIYHPSLNISMLVF